MNTGIFTGFFKKEVPDKTNDKLKETRKEIEQKENKEKEQKENKEKEQKENKEKEQKENKEREQKENREEKEERIIRKVVGSRDNLHSKKNEIYGNMEGYVEIKGLVFEMIKRDIENVELSSIHRMDLKVSINDEIEIKRIEKPKESDYVVCKVEKVNGNGENERIEEEEIIKKIRQIKGPIAVKRTYITEYNGITYKIKIMDQNNKYGMMGKETEIIVT